MAGTPHKVMHETGNGATNSFARMVGPRVSTIGKPTGIPNVAAGQVHPVRAVAAVVAVKRTVGGMLGINFPAYSQSLPPYLRNWVSYLQETIQKNPDVDITHPLAGAGDESPFQQFQQQLGVDLGIDTAGLGDADPTESWQTLVDKLANASFPAQQALQGLRWDTDKGWYRAQTDLLANPKEVVDGTTISRARY